MNMAIPLALQLMMTEYDSNARRQGIQNVAVVVGISECPKRRMLLKDVIVSFEIPENDLYWLYKCIEAEEGNNSYRAKYLSACCILNRVNLGWHASVKAEIFAYNQYEVVLNGMIYDAVPSEETIKACNDAIDHCESWVIAFSMGDKHSGWCEKVEEINGEYYYKAKIQ